VIGGRETSAVAAYAITYSRYSTGTRTDARSQ
jgi:hypothetical protein